MSFITNVVSLSWWRVETSDPPQDLDDVLVVVNGKTYAGIYYEEAFGGGPAYVDVFKGGKRTAVEFSEVAWWTHLPKPPQ